MTRQVLVCTVVILAAIILASPAPIVASSQASANSSPDVAQARHLFDLGNYSAAVTILTNAIARNSNDAEAQFWLARANYEQKDFDNAASHAERAVQIDPKNSLYHLWLGRIYGQQADRERSFSLARKVKKEFEEAVRLNPSNLDARRDLEEFELQAPWVVGGNKDDARQQAEAIAAADPVKGHLAMAEYDREALKKNDLVANEYKQVLESKVDRADAYFEIADYYKDVGKGAEMEPALLAAEKLKPGDPRIGYYRAVQRILTGTQPSAAEPLLKAYIANTPPRSDWPSHASARNWLGRLYELEGKRQQAAEQYRAALELDPTNKDAHAKLEKLEKNSQ
jgi:tetratricopeptide (TPR) repeat protein